MKQVTIRPESGAVQFNNDVSFCVGTGRMGLALQQEYQEQLRRVQELCHFKYIRGHGLFCDDMAIYAPYTDAEGVEHEAYNFTYLDRVMDAYKSLQIKPFIELGFMPEKMASGTQTIFYWKGNVTPPAVEEKWVRMVRATLRHLADRYGEAEVSSWPCEVWNEPNHKGFWLNADRKAYLRLYEITSQAVKAELPDMKVGGPAICGGGDSLEWVHDFLAFCREKKLPLDIFTRHAYMGETPERKGRYCYHTMSDTNESMKPLEDTREIIDSFEEYRGMPMHVTEFNSSYNPLCPIHDLPLNAAIIAAFLARMGEVAVSYSYWTFGDVFEEQGVPARPFHGGFGMMADQCIAKPTLWPFHWFTKLKGTPVARTENAVVMKHDDGSYEAVVWNLADKVVEPVTLTLDVPVEAESCLTVSVVDEDHGNPARIWHAWGEPASLTEDQLLLLRQEAHPHVTAGRVKPGEPVQVTLQPNAVAYLTFAPVKIETEYGYEYGWYAEHMPKKG